MITVTRAQLVKAMPGADQNVILAFEELFTKSPTADTIAATTALQDATALTLSNNDGFSNERVLSFDPSQFSTMDTGPGAAFVVSLLSAISATYGYQLSFNLRADTYLDLPSAGRLIEATLGGATYANDAAAASAGVKVGEVYRVAGGSVAWRQT